MKRVLVVEDNVDFARVLIPRLKKDGCEVDHAVDGEEGLQRALSDPYDLIILDISLPKKDGLEVLSEIRRRGLPVRVMMLTSRSEELDIITGLDSGADDYVTKPFRVGELMARVSALLRRSAEESRMSAGSPNENVLQFGSLTINMESRTASLGGAPLEFTCKEFDVLAFLASRAGQAFTREQILEEVWSDTMADYSGSLNNLIVRIRKKIEDDPANPRLLKTVRGFGYRFTSRDELEIN